MASSGLAGKLERETFWREQVGAWRDEVERAERAGRAAISVREFCRGRGLREPSFYFWRRELSRRGTEPVFAPVTVRPPVATVASPIELGICTGKDRLTRRRGGVLPSFRNGDVNFAGPLVGRVGGRSGFSIVLRVSFARSISL